MRASRWKRGKRRLRLYAEEVPWLSLLNRILPSFAPAGKRGKNSVSVQRISGLQRQFAADFDDLYCARNRVNIYQANGSRNRFDLTNHILISAPQDDRRTVRAVVIGRRDQFSQRVRTEAVHLLLDQFKICRTRLAHDQGNW